MGVLRSEDLLNVVDPQNTQKYSENWKKKTCPFSCAKENNCGCPGSVVPDNERTTITRFCLIRLINNFGLKWHFGYKWAADHFHILQSGHFENKIMCVEPNQTLWHWFWPCQKIKYGSQFPSPCLTIFRVRSQRRYSNCSFFYIFIPLLFYLKNDEFFI